MSLYELEGREITLISGPTGVHLYPFGNHRTTLIRLSPTVSNDDVTADTFRFNHSGPNNKEDRTFHWQSKKNIRVQRRFRFLVGYGFAYAESFPSRFVRQAQASYVIMQMK